MPRSKSPSPSPSKSPPPARPLPFRPPAAAALGDRLYWLLPVALALVQALFTAAADELLRYEEVAESIRNVYWLDQRMLYDGISTNVGWYGLLLGVYRLFGFSLATAQWVRFALHAGALLCLAWVLRHRVFRPPAPAWAAAVPLAAIGLSPTLLYFNTIRTTFATDLVYAAYCLGLLFLLPRAGRAASAALHAALGAVAMVAAMSYPVFLFYLPALAVAWWLRLGQAAGARRAGRLLRDVGAAALGAALPLAAAALYLRDPARLFYDPATGSGIFRGGGVGFGLPAAELAANVARVGRDLVWRGTSYYFWLTEVDLDGVLGIACALFVAAAAAWLLVRRPAWRPLIAASVLAPAVAVAVASASLGPPGLRRATIVLAGFYVLYTLVWRELLAARLFAPAADPGAGPGADLDADLGVGPAGESESELDDDAARPLPPGARLRALGLAVCLALPVHHVLALAVDFREVPWAGPEQRHIFFAAPAPAGEQLAGWLAATAAGEPLDCRKVGLEPARCRYAGIFGTLAGYRAWNDLPAVPLRAVDPVTGEVVELAIERWEEGRLPR